MDAVSIQHSTLWLCPNASNNINNNQPIKNSGQWRRTTNASHAYNNNYAIKWKDVGSHSCKRQMMLYILPFAPFCHRRSRCKCETFCTLCDLCFLWWCATAGMCSLVRVGCRYVIVRRTTMAYWGTAGFYVCRNCTVVRAIQVASRIHIRYIVILRNWYCSWLWSITT